MKKINRMYIEALESECIYLRKLADYCKAVDEEEAAEREALKAERDYYKEQYERERERYECVNAMEESLWEDYQRVTSELDKYKAALKVVCECLDDVREFYSERDGEIVHGHYVPAWRVMDELGI